jgi:apolipoprotein D and lipocalin family protein
MRVLLHNSYGDRRLLPGAIVLFYMVSSVMTFYSPSSLALPTLRTVDYVDLDRFMGKWYVIACIPTFIEKDIFNATETYRRASNGTIETTFTFTKGGFSGPRKTYRPTGFIDNTDTNAVWGMQFIWPIKADYRIVYLDANYQRTVVAREKRDYVWLMSRDPILSEEEYAGFVQLIVSLGYSENQLRRVPQKWIDTSLD